MKTLSLQMLLLPSVAALVGCGGAPQMDYSRVNLVNAHGTVTLDGQPLPAAVITFDDANGGYSYAMTDANGEYELQFDSDMQGVTPGTKTVRISTTRKLLGLTGEEEVVGEESPQDAPPQPTEKELIPARYNDQSELTVEVTPEQTQYDFALTS